MYDGPSDSFDDGGGTSLLGERFYKHGTVEQRAAGDWQGVPKLRERTSAFDCVGLTFSLFSGFSGEPDEQGSFDQYDRTSVLGISCLRSGDAGMVYLDRAIFHVVSGETERESREDGAGLRRV